MKRFTWNALKSLPNVKNQVQNYSKKTAEQKLLNAKRIREKAEMKEIKTKLNLLAFQSKSLRYPHLQKAEKKHAEGMQVIGANKYVLPIADPSSKCTVLNGHFYVFGSLSGHRTYYDIPLPSVEFTMNDLNIVTEEKEWVVIVKSRYGYRFDDPPEEQQQD